MKKNYVLIVICVLLICLIAKNYINIKSIDLDGASFNGYDITISGDYVFYQKLRKYGTDLEAKNLKSGQVTKIARRRASNVYISDNMIYFSAPWGFGVDERMFRRKLQGIREYKLNNISVDDLKVKSGQLFYRKIAHASDKDYADNGNIYKINLKSKKSEKVLPYNVSFFIVTDEHLYFSLSENEFFDSETTSKGIYRYSLKEKTTEMIVNDIVHQFYISDNNLFYSRAIDVENDKELYDLLCLNLDTNECKIVANKILEFNVCGKFICYVHKDAFKCVNVMNISSNELKQIEVESLNWHKNFVFYNNKLFYYDMNNKFCEK